jgi:hypothetical protein
MVQQLQQQLLTLRQQQQQQPVQHPFQPNPHPPTFCPPKVNPPQEFNGDHSKTSSFNSKCELVFHIHISSQPSNLKSFIPVHIYVALCLLGTDISMNTLKSIPGTNGKIFFS